MAVSHLVTLGHKKIAFLNGSLYSLVADSAQYHVPAFLEEGATAIICGNDLLAQGAIEYCTSNGYRVPEDISIIGFDNIPISGTTEPPLTTIAQQRNELGKCAYTILHSLISHVAISKTLLRPALVERESTARI